MYSVKCYLRLLNKDGGILPVLALLNVIYTLGSKFKDLMYFRFFVRDIKSTFKTEIDFMLSILAIDLLDDNDK